MTQYGACSLLHIGTIPSCSCANLTDIDFALGSVNPDPVTVCGTLACPNALPQPKYIPGKERVNASTTITADKIPRYEAFEEAGKGIRDYHVETMTTSATPGSMPKPVPRDTSTPAEPTTVLSVEQASTQIDGWEIAVHQDRQQTTTGSDQSMETKGGASKVLERLLSFF